eukprot:6190168-Pleurochrysis_carterae.AAC.1
MPPSFARRSVHCNSTPSSASDVASFVPQVNSLNCVQSAELAIPSHSALCQAKMAKSRQGRFDITSRVLAVS